MKIVFVSNYYNHHQSTFSQELFKMTDGQYTFIQTEEMEADRKKLGWGLELPSYVKCSYESKEIYQECTRLVMEADVVITGGNPAAERLVQKRIKSGKLVFRYSERVYKNTRARKQMLLRGVKYHYCNFPYRNVYLLSASAYAAADYAKTGNFLKKAYRWGYFPQVKQYEDIRELLQKKVPGSILWVARLIDWKHPEACLEVAKRLKKEGYFFRLAMIGTGELAADLQQKICEEGLSDCVELLGAMKPEQVRAHMEKSSVFLFTSDFEEGWGAVLNEAMNSGCAVIASHAIGAAPYLVKDGENGLLYCNGDMEDLYCKVVDLLTNPERQRQLGEKAYYTMVSCWNPQEAARRLIKLAQSICSGDSKPEIFQEGPGSRAPILKNDWYA